MKVDNLLIIIGFTMVMLGYLKFCANLCLNNVVYELSTSHHLIIYIILIIYIPHYLNNIKLVIYTTELNLGLEALEKSGVSNHFDLAHATPIASKKNTPTNLVSGSTAPTLSSHALSSSTIAVLVGAVLSRETVGLKKNSALHGPVLASTKNSALKDPAIESRKNSALGSGCARDDGMVGGVMGVVQGEETEPGDLGEGGAVATLGMRAADLVDHKEGHVHAGLAAGGSAAHVLGGKPLVTSGLALAQARAGHVGASLVRPCKPSCKAPFDVLGSGGHVTPKLAVEHVLPCDDHVLPSTDHVLPCMAFERAHPVYFIFSAHVGASTTMVSPPSMAAMEVDRKHFKWKRVARRGMQLRLFLGFSGKLVVECVGRSGGLVLFWSSQLDISLLSFSLFHIDVSVSVVRCSPWRFTGFYGIGSLEV
ncbi:hypothetical protein ACOSQ3_033472 [Xanthoceras sorbifolium]